MSTEYQTQVSSFSRDARLHILSLLGICLIIGLGLLSFTSVSSILSRARAIDAAELEMYSLISDIKVYSMVLYGTTGDLSQEVIKLGQTIESLKDQDAKHQLENLFTPASKTLDQVLQIVVKINRRFFESEDFWREFQEHGKQSWAPNLNLIPESLAQTSGLHQQSHPPISNLSPELKKMYEETAQKRDKINMIEHGFYFLGGIGCVLLIVLIFVPDPTKQTLAEIAKMYVPALMSSWATFIAAISI